MYMVVVGRGVSMERRESSTRLREQSRGREREGPKWLKRWEPSFNGDFRGREIDGREMKTWRAVCSREEEGENRDNGEGSHLGLHFRLRCDGGRVHLLKRVGDPPSLGCTQHGQKSPIPPRPRFCVAIPWWVHRGDATDGIGICRRKQARKIVQFQDININPSYLGYNWSMKGCLVTN